jgi:hypothetical protein
VGYLQRVGALTVAIKIRRVLPDRYEATLTPPHGLWRTREPLPARELRRTLQGLGCHTTDISDALFEADPLWLNRLSADS